MALRLKPFNSLWFDKLTTNGFGIITVRPELVEGPSIQATQSHIILSPEDRRKPLLPQGEGWDEGESPAQVDLGLLQMQMPTASSLLNSPYLLEL